MRTPKKSYTGSFASETPSVCIVGAGFGGILAAIQLKRRLGLTTFTILDKNHDVGGVWLTTKYPGLGVDFPGFMNCYTFEMNYDNTKIYPHRAEVWQYLHRMAIKYKLYEHIRFGTTMSAMSWTGQNWIVSTSTTTGNDPPKIQEEEFDMVVMAKGPFNQAKFPEKFRSFTGTVMHSAHWDSNVPLENKVVGVVGSSASAVQLIPSIAPLVKELVSYQRSASYVVVKGQMRIPGWVNFIFRWFPGLTYLLLAVTWFMAEIWAIGCASTRNWGSNVSGAVFLFCMKCGVKDATLRKKLKPDYKFGVRVPCTSDTFYRTLTKKYVRLETGAIQKVEGNEIVTEDGNRQKLDVLILCTGYRMRDFFAPIKVTGALGQDLMKLWSMGRPKTYYGTTCSAAPNFFILLGPNTMVFNGFVFTMECQMNLVINVTRHMMKTGAAVFNVKEEAEEDCVRDLERRIKNSIWDGEGHQATWAYNVHGDFMALWPGTSTSFWWKTRKFDANKFEFQNFSLMQV